MKYMLFVYDEVMVLNLFVRHISTRSVHTAGVTTSHNSDSGFKEIFF